MHKTVEDQKSTLLKNLINIIEKRLLAEFSLCELLNYINWQFCFKQVHSLIL